MDNQRPILSICIPTNGAVNWVIPTLESIYNQGVDNSLFDVIITDNGEDSKLGEALERFSYGNLKYIQTNDKGFLNLISALKLGDGVYHKMLNHRSQFTPGALMKMIDVVKKYKDTKPVLYCSSGALGNRSIFECKDTNEFVHTLHEYCSWSGGIGVWDIDIPNIDDIECNEMFPNTSLLLELRQESKYVIWNERFQEQQSQKGKGGYDVFHTFAVVFNDIMKDLLDRNRITEDTFRYVKGKLYKHLCKIYSREKLTDSPYTFIVKDIKKSMRVYYSASDYYFMVLKAYTIDNVYYTLRYLKHKFIGVKQ